MASPYDAPNQKETASLRDSSSSTSAPIQPPAIGCPTMQRPPTPSKSPISRGTSPVEVNESDPAERLSHSPVYPIATPVSTSPSVTTPSSVHNLSNLGHLLATSSTPLDYSPQSISSNSPISTATGASVPSAHSLINLPSSEESLPAPSVIASTTAPTSIPSDCRTSQHQPSALASASTPRHKRRKQSKTRETIKIVNATFKAIGFSSTTDQRHSWDRTLVRPFKAFDSGYLVKATKSDYHQFLKHQDLTLAKRARTRYHRCGIVISMPGELHQSLVGACHEFAANIKRRVLEKGWKLPSGSEVKLVKGGGQMTVWSNDNKYSRDPDMSMKVVDGTQIKPFFIFEVAVSQTEDDLMKKAHHYLNGSHGDITLICLIIAKSDPVVDRKLDLQDVSVRIFIARIGRSSPTASGTWKPELFVMYDATKRVDADKANRPTFSGHITISKQDIWAKRGVVLPPGDSIDIPLDLFSSEIEDAVQSHLDDQYVLAATSPASNQSDLTTESSEGSSAGKSSASGGDDKGKDSDYEQSSPPSEESDD